MTATKMLPIALVLLGAAAPDALAADAESRAIAKAKCVEAAHQAAYEYVMKKSPKLGHQWTEADREAYQKLRAQSDKTESERISKCITNDEGEAIGWFSFLSDQFGDGKKFDICGLKPTKAVSNSLLNAVAVMGEPKLVDGQTTGPYAEGQRRATSWWRAQGYRDPRQACAEVYRDFGPKGERFPGLLKK